MNSKQRKVLFVSLLEQMLLECDGVKGKLAQQLEIGRSTLTHWLQGKIDPGELGIKTFSKIAAINGISIDALARELGFTQSDPDKSLEKFRKILKELLASNSQDELALKIGISQAAISKWLDSEKKFDLDKISAIRIAAIAKEKGWTIEELLIYLDLKKVEKQNNLFFEVKSNANILSLNDRVKLLAWLFDRVQQEITQEKVIDKLVGKQSLLTSGSYQDRTLLIILEQENMAIASNYLQKIYVHTNINPENITIATIQHLPEAIAASNILIFDISSSDSPSIAKIEEIEFDGDIIVFAPEDLPSEVMANLSVRVTDLVIKPINWNSLKDKEYFR